MSSMVAQSLPCLSRYGRDKIQSKQAVNHKNTSIKRVFLKIKGVKIGEANYNSAPPIHEFTDITTPKIASNHHDGIEKLGKEEPVKDIVDLLVVAKTAADAVARKRLPTTSHEFKQCLNALNNLKRLSLLSCVDSIKTNQVLKCLPYLMMHPKVKIRTEANNVLEAWKKSTWEIPQMKKFREHIEEALSKVITELSDESSRRRAEASDPAQIAACIEYLMYKKMGQSNGKADKAKYRSILFNLRDPKNPDLRRHVLLGEIKPEKLIDMTAEEMASSKRKRENDEIRMRHMMQCGIIKEDEETTDQFRCGRCGERKCTYNQLQTRSADEPMTTYVRCVVCSNRWKF